MNKLFLLLIFQIMFTGMNFAQKAGEEPGALVRLPAESGAVFVLVQPKCPISFEKFELFVTKNGSSPELRFLLRNSSAKGIRFFAVGFYKKFHVGGWHRYGMGNGLAVGREDGLGPTILRSGAKFENFSIMETDIAPMNDKVSELLKSNKGDSPLKIIWFASVTKVIFDDGTVYDDGGFSDNSISFFY